MIAASQILEHRVFTSFLHFSIDDEWLSREQRLDRNHRVRNDRRHLMRCAARIGEIDNDETGQMCKSTHSFCQIPAGGFFEVE